ncbi:MAG TPA: hypothetical protein VFI33_13350, partial [Puia sp.]|nr:hypothetical protein [Puia sp.]
LKEEGLLTNPVHVLDLALVLPGFIITAYLLKKDSSVGKLLVPYILIFCILMFINIEGLLIMLNSSKPASIMPVTGFVILTAGVAVYLLRIVFHRYKIMQDRKN